MRPDNEAQEERSRDHADAHQHRDARAIDDARENVAAQFVCAKPMRNDGHQTRGQIDARRILRRDPWRKDRADQQYDHHHRARGCQGVMSGGTVQGSYLDGSSHRQPW